MPRPKATVATTITTEKPAKELISNPMWLKYHVKLMMHGRFAASLPRTLDEITKMLENRMPTNPPAEYTPIKELAKSVAAKVGIDDAETAEEEESEFKFGWATFPHDEKGLYYEGRCIRGHLKDSATQVSGMFTEKINAFKAKVANKVYVVDDKIYIGKKEPDGTEQRFIQIMTRMGPRSTIKYLDYVEDPVLEFNLKVLNDGVITLDILKVIFDYGSVHGLGQERSQGWGRYEYEITGV